MSPEEIIAHLQLEKHPEGGYYRETYRAEYSIATGVGEIRNVSTAIYFMLCGKEISHFHRIKSDELWFFHQGSPILIYWIEKTGLKTIILGNNINAGEYLQAVIPADTWFAARIIDGNGYGLVSCTVSPGFDFADFELADRNSLISEYPSLKEIITEFTRA